MKKQLPHFSALVLFWALLTQAAAFGAVRYVKAGATGAKDGTSWADAFPELVSAINAAQPGDEIWIATGIYYPDFDPVNRVHTNNRMAHFGMKSDVSLFGGFVGTETLRSQRNSAANRTILSGDIGVPGAATDNSCSIMATADYNTPALSGVIIDGLIFAGGYANAAGGAGNGVAGSNGGAVNIYSGAAEFRHCTFVGNYGLYGGAIQLNYASGTGLRVINCTFASNGSQYAGGAIMFGSYVGLFSVQNCTMVNNYSARASVIGVNTLATTTYTNNLIYGNPGGFGLAKVEVGGTTPISSNNVLEETLSPAGTNNLVVTSSGLLHPPSAGPDGRWGTMDDILDAPLVTGAPGIDLGSANYLPADTTDLDGDGDVAESIPYDSLHQPRVRDNAPDVGAFEFFDTETLPPLLTYPAAGSRTRSPVAVVFTLPEPAKAGTVTLRFANAGNTCTLTLASVHESAGAHGFNFDPANPVAASDILSGPSIPDGTYDVTLSYQDLLGHPAASVVSTGVTIDSQAPLLVLDAGAMDYQENATTAISPGAQAADALEDWNGGILTVQLTTNAFPEDSVAIGPDTGLTISAGGLFDGATTFATVSPANGKVTGGAKLTVTLNTNATSARVQRLVRALVFSNATDNPSSSVRTTTITLADAAGGLSSAIRLVTVTPVNDVPVVVAGGSITFTESNKGVSTPVTVAAALTVTDPDALALFGATVTITGSYTPGVDVLALVANPATMSSITGSFNAQLGVLTLSANGGAPGLTQWRDALRSVTYNNLSDTPNTTPRSIIFVVSDGAAMSLPATRTINVVAVNDTPIVSGQNLTTAEDTPLAVALTGTDPDNDPLTFPIVAQPLHGTLTSSGGNGAALTYTPAANFKGADSFTFRANDGSANSATATVNITVTAVNDPPTVGQLPNLDLAEDAGTQVIPLSGIGSGPPDEIEKVTITASSDNPALIPNPDVFYTPWDVTGLISFTPVADANGTAHITVTVDDGQAVNHLTTRTFTVTVAAVNDAPSFTAGGGLTVTQDAGPQTYANWATNISNGPANEAGQTHQFVAMVDDPQFFTQRPSVAPDGTLTFTPAADASGTTTVQVFLRDGGGTARGGVNISDVQTFQITLTTYAEELGLYTGLVHAADGLPATQDRTGLLRVTITKGGLFTGSLRVGTFGVPLTGRFGKDGVAHFGVAGSTSFALPKPGPSLSLTLQLDVSGGSSAITGVLSDGAAPAATILAERAWVVPGAKTVPPLPAGLAGRYTVLLGVTDATRDPATFPGGSGFGMLTVSPAGMVTLTGTLPDGTPVVCTSPLSKNLTWPLYIPLVAGKGSLSGVVTFRDVAATSDCDALQMDWFKPANTLPGALYPAGWMDGLHPQLVGSKFVLPLPAAHQSVLPGLSNTPGVANATFAFELGGLADPGFTQGVNINDRNRVVPIQLGPQRMQATLAPTGLFTGRFLHPVSHQSVVFRGAVLQKQSLGAGYFIGLGAAGGVTLTPLP